MIVFGWIIVILSMLTAWMAHDPGTGLLFNKNALLDIYARAVTGQSALGIAAQQFLRRQEWSGMICTGETPHSLDNSHGKHRLIYELHVRGFTRHFSSASSESRNL
ncbi:MAG: hypothetical protein V8S42_09350 [Lachnospiraceae bacterium]